MYVCRAFCAHSACEFRLLYWIFSLCFFFGCCLEVGTFVFIFICNSSMLFLASNITCSHRRALAANNRPTVVILWLQMHVFWFWSFARSCRVGWVVGRVFVIQIRGCLSSLSDCRTYIDGAQIEHEPRPQIYSARNQFIIINSLFSVSSVGVSRPQFSWRWIIRRRQANGAFAHCVRSFVFNTRWSIVFFRVPRSRCCGYG